MNTTEIKQPQTEGERIVASALEHDAWREMLPAAIDAALVRERRVCVEKAREDARDYATRAARLRSDGSEAALIYADEYTAKADALRTFVDALEAAKESKDGSV